MGTRGLIGFYKKKVTKAIYNHYDSYFSCLGQLIVDHINEHIKNDMNWVETLKKLLDKVKLIEKEQDGEIHYQNIITSLKDFEDYAYHTSEYEPVTDIFIEFIYIIDIDMMKFKVIPTNTESYNRKVFKLTSIPKNWDKFCTVDPESDEEEENKENKEEIVDDKDDKYNKMICMMNTMMEKIEKLEKIIEQK